MHGRHKCVLSEGRFFIWCQSGPLSLHLLPALHLWWARRGLSKSRALTGAPAGAEPELGQSCELLFLGGRCSIHRSFCGRSSDLQTITQGQCYQPCRDTANPGGAMRVHSGARPRQISATGAEVPSPACMRALGRRIRDRQQHHGIIGTMEPGQIMAQVNGRNRQVACDRPAVVAERAKAKTRAKTRPKAKPKGSRKWNRNRMVLGFRT